MKPSAGVPFRTKRRHGRILYGVLIVSLSAASQLVGQHRDQSTFRTSGAAVVVDVVARDRNQRPVSGLRASDFELYEDGIRQTITAFDEVGEATVALSADSTGHDAPGDMKVLKGRAPGVVALVFEQLSPTASQLAENAAKDFITSSTPTGLYAGVFQLDRSLHLVAPYSTDASALLKGIRAAALRPGYALEHAGAVPGPEFGSPEAGQVSRSTREDSPFMRAHATLDGLDELIRSLEETQGRKAVILFSEGLALMPAQDKSMFGSSAAPDSWLSDNRRDHFNRVLEHASRAHVAFYTFDARGLRIESPNVQAFCFGCGAEVGLKILADETGGAFADGNNDLRKAVRRVSADLAHYYLLGYTPTNSKLDNTYRRLEVKTHRQNVRLLARKGYVAASRTAVQRIEKHFWDHPEER